ncbi:hypothetical protein [Clostridium sp. JS66]|uniref:hypothetical protein n=1 Tax=Clostridium sp. JS66 TaxID=3064705 RepID=UPI00298DFD10|nr:hypothetical protein [Clostridium sp. JS66]WPC42802.1 hypothetical protein Q6H37_04855 [Clostridium sp. JS66]
MDIKQLMYDELNQVKTEAYIEKETLKREFVEKAKEEAVFAIMGEQIRIAYQLIGLLDDNVISNITGVSVSHLQCMKS